MASPSGPTWAQHISSTTNTIPTQSLVTTPTTTTTTVLEKDSITSQTLKSADDHSTDPSNPNSNPNPNPTQVQHKTICVLDSGAFIESIDFLKNITENCMFLTTQNVIREIRDPRSRERLTQLKSQIKVTQPDKESIQFVHSFATKTGDIKVLSLIDLEILALTVMMEKQMHNGSLAHLNESPQQIPDSVQQEMINETLTSKVNPFFNPRDDFYDDPQNIRKSSTLTNAHQVDSINITENIVSDNVSESNGASSSKSHNSLPSSIPQPSLAQKKKKRHHRGRKKKKTQNNSINSKDVVSEAPLVASSTSLTENSSPQEISTKQTFTSMLASHNQLPEEHRMDNWITEENINYFDIDDTLVTSVVDFNQPQIYCLTTDYAMQNVLIQMGCNVLSKHGRKISQLKTWGSQCYTCQWTTIDPHYQFCQECGHGTMTRISYIVEKDGQVVFSKRKGSFRKKGLVGTLPAPKTGRAKRYDIVLSEDVAQELERKFGGNSRRGYLHGDEYIEKLSDQIGDHKHGKNKDRRRKDIQYATHVQVGLGGKNLHQMKSRKTRKR